MLGGITLSRAALRGAKSLWPPPQLTAGSTDVWHEGIFPKVELLLMAKGKLKPKRAKQLLTVHN